VLPHRSHLRSSQLRYFSEISKDSAPLKSALSLIFLIFLLIIPPFAHESATAQDAELNRISTATRGDGLGYVIRFHFSAAPDSFKLLQPSGELIQVAVYKNGLKHDDVSVNTYEPFTGIESVKIPGGIGTDINLEPGNNYLAQAYMDANRRDLLVGLTRISSREMELITDGFNPVNWAALYVRDEEPDPAPDPDGSSLVTRSDTPTGSDPPDTLSAPELDDIPEPEPFDEDEEFDSDRFFAEIDRSSIRFNTIIIDPGHGGRDPGALGARGSREKDVALAISKKVGEYIKENLPELNVVFTRSDDTFISLDERGRIANRNQGDLFVSIHANSHRNRQAFGAEVYFLGLHRTQDAFEVMKRENSVVMLEDGNQQNVELSEDQLLVYELTNSSNMASSQMLAELIDRQFAERARRRSRGVKQAGLQVLWHASMPGVLVEVGFISNPEEERFMTSEYGQAILASAIFRAIRDYKELVQNNNRNR